MKSPEYYLGNHLWLTADNRELPIASMSNDHLLSSYHRCIRNNWRLSFIPLLLAELDSRGFRTTNPELFI